MNQKETIKCLSDELDKWKRKEQIILESGDEALITTFQTEKQSLLNELAKLRKRQEKALSDKAQKLIKMPFSRVITKKEQSDMGAFKKSLKTKVEIVHPMTVLGREMGIREVTGFALKPF